MKYVLHTALQHLIFIYYGIQSKLEPARIYFTYIKYFQLKNWMPKLSARRCIEKQLQLNTPSTIFKPPMSSIYT